MAMDQVVRLMQTPQDEILFRTIPIVEHNFNVMMQTDWYGEYFLPAFTGYFNQ